MKSLPRMTVLLGVMLAVVLVAGLSVANGRAQENEPLRMKEAPELDAGLPIGTLDAPTAETRVDTLRSQPQLQVPLPETAQLQAVESPDADCFQLLANPQLDIVEFGDGTGSAEPWVVLTQEIYFFTDSYTSPAYSLGMEDGDEGSGSEADEDAFGQGFFMPTQLESVVVEYSHAAYQLDAADEVYGALWSLDKDGFLDEVLVAWTVGQPDETDAWSNRFVEITSSADLSPMNGTVMAMTFFTYGNRQEPFEFALFDDVQVTACVKSTPAGPGQLYLPTIMNKAGLSSGPICVPPNEMPQDQYNANRGLVQTGATCNSTMSNVDRADYYTFKPTKNGAHTLNLRDLPAGTEWSAMIFVDKDSPEYAPGPTTGQCRIGTPGSGDKSVTCTLNKNTDYFVKVSAGSLYSGAVGTYEMQITGP